MSIMMMAAWRCDLCGHVWLARGPRPPALCARCRKRRWNTGKWDGKLGQQWPELAKVERGPLRFVMVEGIGVVVAKDGPPAECQGRGSMNPWHEAHRGHRFEAQEDGIACLDCGGVFPWPEGEFEFAGRATPTAQDAGHGVSPEAVAKEAERNPHTLTSVHPPPAGRLAHWPTPQAFDAVELDVTPEDWHRRRGGGSHPQPTDLRVCAQLAGPQERMAKGPAKARARAKPKSKAGDT
jgi:hypothetical protein